jgi:hypothetical protein
MSMSRPGGRRASSFGPRLRENVVNVVGVEPNQAAEPDGRQETGLGVVPNSSFGNGQTACNLSRREETGCFRGIGGIHVP